MTLARAANAATMTLDPCSAEASFVEARIGLRKAVLLTLRRQYGDSRSEAMVVDYDTRRRGTSKEARLGLFPPNLFSNATVRLGLLL